MYGEKAGNCSRAWEVAHAAACPSVQRGHKARLLEVSLNQDALVSSLHIAYVSALEE